MWRACPVTRTRCMPPDPRPGYLNRPMGASRSRACSMTATRFPWARSIAPDNPELVYIGTGEGFPRNSTSVGDGIYKTEDGGRTWRHMGLKDSERFSRIVISPKDSRV